MAKNSVLEHAPIDATADGEDFDFVMDYTHQAPWRERDTSKNPFSRQVINGVETLFFGRREAVTRDTTDLDGKVDARNWNTVNEAGEQIGIGITIESSGRWEKAYAFLSSEFEKRLGEAQDAESIAKAAYGAVAENIHYSKEGVGKLYDYTRNGQEADGIAPRMDLGNFIEARTAVCHEMALMAAWVVQEAGKKGQIPDRISAVCHVGRQDVKGGGAHSWMRLTDDEPTLSGGEPNVYIADPSRATEDGYTVATLQQLYLKSRLPGSREWEYFIDKKEKERVKARVLGGGVLNEYQPGSNEAEVQASPESQEANTDPGRFTIEFRGVASSGWEPALARVTDTGVEVTMVEIVPDAQIDNPTNRKNLSLPELVSLQVTDELKSAIKIAVRDLLGPYEEETTSDSKPHKPGFIDDVPKPGGGQESSSQSLEAQFEQSIRLATAEVNKMFDELKSKLDNSEDMKIWRWASAKMSRRQAVQDRNYSAAGGYKNDEFAAEREVPNDKTHEAGMYLIYMQYLEAINRCQTQDQLDNLMAQFRT